MFFAADGSIRLPPPLTTGHPAAFNLPNASEWIRGWLHKQPYQSSHRFRRGACNGSPGILPATFSAAKGYWKEIAL